MRSVTVREPDWTEHDRSIAQAWLVYQSGLCHGCGRHLSLTTGEDQAEMWWPGKTEQCYGCTALEMSYERVDKEANPRHAALRHSIENRPGAKRKKPPQRPDPTTC